MKALFEELMPRIENVETDGDPEYIRAFWVTGLKKLPIKYTIAGNDGD